MSLRKSPTLETGFTLLFPMLIRDFDLFLCLWDSEVEDIIWETDEDGDGLIDWENFVLLYGRARCDKKSKEPRRLFNLIDFMMCDKDAGGTIDEDECLEILYRRYGKRAMEKLQDKLLKMFGREIDYGEFVELVGSNVDGGGKMQALLEEYGLAPTATPVPPPKRSSRTPR
mmetsp:Transcript_34788/g.78583  ORF Transcript_34788/g.78583 Transcript_34788/m.78583 type:complete len:171 (+) Transcript_34788:302-814(+)